MTDFALMRPVPRKPAALQVASLLVLAALTALVVWRAGSEASLWVDESYSLQVSEFSARQLVEIAEGDFHPPGYYLLLAAWREAGDLVAPGVPPLLWARSMNGVFWLLAVLGGAWLGRSLGKGSSVTIALLVASSAPLASMTQDLRAYGPVASLFLLSCVALVVYQACEERRRVAAAVCGLSMGLALWLHTLAWLLLALLFLVAASADVRSRRRGRLPLASIALVGSALLGAPWLVRISGQAASFVHADTSWMTPPSLANLGNSVWFWLLGSRLGPPSQASNMAVAVLIAIAGLAVAFAYALGSLPVRAEGQPARAIRHLLAACLGFIVLTWLLARLGIAPVFHGPRYQLLVAPATLCLVGGLLQTRPGRLAQSAIGLLLLASITAQLVLLKREVLQEPRLSALVDEAMVQSAGGPIVVLPASLRGFHARAAEGLQVLLEPAAVCRAETPVVVLTLSPWHNLLRGADRVLVTQLARGDVLTLSESSAPPGLNYYRLTTARRSDTVSTDRCEAAYARPSWVPRAAAWASPANQAGLGWSYLEVGDTGEPYIWATKERATVFFDQAATKGRVRLVLRGYSWAAADSPVDLHLQIGDQTLVRTVSAGFEIDARFELSKSVGHIRIVHPPKEIGARKVTFSLIGAYLE